MTGKEKVDVLKVQAAGKCIKQGIIAACKIAGQDPVLHYTALAMEVSIYLETWADVAGIDKQKAIDEFHDALKEGVKNIIREGN
jgi:hypothetical protein